MAKINLDSIVVDKRLTFWVIFNKYKKIEEAINNSNERIKKLREKLTTNEINKYFILHDNQSKFLNEFLKAKPLVAEYINELDNNSNLLVKEKDLLLHDINITILSDDVISSLGRISIGDLLLNTSSFYDEKDLSIYEDDVRNLLIKASNIYNKFLNEQSSNNENIKKR